MNDKKERDEYSVTKYDPWRKEDHLEFLNFAEGPHGSTEDISVDGVILWLQRVSNHGLGKLTLGNRKGEDMVLTLDLAKHPEIGGLWVITMVES